VTPRLRIEALQLADLAPLARVLREEPVYRHLGGSVPDEDTFRRQLAAALQGPPPTALGEVWLNYSVRRAADVELLGFTQATVHHGLAEVAFLFGVRYWGQGYATESLLCLHQILLARDDCHALWACTVPANIRSRALLLRAGYVEATADRPALLATYDEGDLVYRGPRRGAS